MSRGKDCALDRSAKEEEEGRPNGGKVEQGHARVDSDLWEVKYFLRRLTFRLCQGYNVHGGKIGLNDMLRPARFAFA